MKLVDSIKTRIGERSLERKLRQQKRCRVFCNLQQAQHIGILYDATEFADFETIRDFIKGFDSNRTTVSALGYVHAKTLHDQYMYRKGFDFFTRENLNFLSQPVTERTAQFISEPFDILMNLSLEDYLPVRYITALSAASLKAGMYRSTDKYLDLMIDIGPPPPQAVVTDRATETRNLSGEVMSSGTGHKSRLKLLIEQLVHYLSIINNPPPYEEN